MTNGLSDLQKKELKFIRHLVSDVKEFDLGKMKNLIEEYKKHDPAISEILKESKERADLLYFEKLDSQILKPSALKSVGVDYSVLNESTVLEKVSSFLQKPKFNEMEYRERYLNRAIVETTLSRDKMMRENYRANEKTLGKSISDLGIDFSR